MVALPTPRPSQVDIDAFEEATRSEMREAMRRARAPVAADIDLGDPESFDFAMTGGITGSGRALIRDPLTGDLRTSQEPAMILTDKQRQAGNFAQGLAMGLTTDLLGLPADLLALILRDAPQLGAALTKSLTSGTPVAEEIAEMSKNPSLLDSALTAVQNVVGGDALARYAGATEATLQDPGIQTGRIAAAAFDPFLLAGLGRRAQAGVETLTGDVMPELPTGAPTRQEPSFNIGQDSEVVEGIGSLLPAPRTTDPGPPVGAPDTPVTTTPGLDEPRMTVAPGVDETFFGSGIPLTEETYRRYISPSGPRFGGNATWNAEEGRWQYPNEDPLDVRRGLVNRTPPEQDNLESYLQNFRNRGEEPPTHLNVDLETGELRSLEIRTERMATPEETAAFIRGDDPSEFAPGAAVDEAPAADEVVEADFTATPATAPEADEAAELFDAAAAARDVEPRPEGVAALQFDPKMNTASEYARPSDPTSQNQVSVLSDANKNEFGDVKHYSQVSTFLESQLEKGKIGRRGIRASELDKQLSKGELGKEYKNSPMQFALQKDLNVKLKPDEVRDLIREKLPQVATRTFTARGYKEDYDAGKSPYGQGGINPGGATEQFSIDYDTGMVNSLRTMQVPENIQKAAIDAGVIVYGDSLGNPVIELPTGQKTMPTVGIYDVAGDHRYGLADYPGFFGYNSFQTIREALPNEVDGGMFDVLIEVQSNTIREIERGSAIGFNTRKSATFVDADGNSIQPSQLDFNIPPEEYANSVAYYANRKLNDGTPIVVGVDGKIIPEFNPRSVLESDEIAQDELFQYGGENQLRPDQMAAAEGMHLKEYMNVRGADFSVPTNAKPNTSLRYQQDAFERYVDLQRTKPASERHTLKNYDYGTKRYDYVKPLEERLKEFFQVERKEGRREGSKTLGQEGLRIPYDDEAKDLVEAYYSLMPKRLQKYQIYRGDVEEYDSTIDMYTQFVKDDPNFRSTYEEVFDPDGAFQKNFDLEVYVDSDKDLMISLLPDESMLSDMKYRGNQNQDLLSADTQQFISNLEPFIEDAAFRVLSGAGMTTTPQRLDDVKEILEKRIRYGFAQIETLPVNDASVRLTPEDLAGRITRNEAGNLFHTIADAGFSKKLAEINPAYKELVTNPTAEQMRIFKAFGDNDEQIQYVKNLVPQEDIDTARKRAWELTQPALRSYKGIIPDDKFPMTHYSDYTSTSEYARYANVDKFLLGIRQNVREAPRYAKLKQAVKNRAAMFEEGGVLDQNERIRLEDQHRANIEALPEEEKNRMLAIEQVINATIDPKSLYPAGNAPAFAQDAVGFLALPPIKSEEEFIRFSVRNLLQDAMNRGREGVIIPSAKTFGNERSGLSNKRAFDIMYGSVIDKELEAFKKANPDVSVEVRNKSSDGRNVDDINGDDIFYMAVPEMNLAANIDDVGRYSKMLGLTNMRVVRFNKGANREVLQRPIRRAKGGDVDLRPQKMIHSGIGAMAREMM